MSSGTWMDAREGAILTDAIEPDLLRRLAERFDAQAEAEARAFGRPKGKHAMGSMVNKGKVFTDLVEHPMTDELAGYLLGRHFLVSSVTGHLFHGEEPHPQPLHRDQVRGVSLPRGGNGVTLAGATTERQT